MHMQLIRKQYAYTFRADLDQNMHLALEQNINLKLKVNKKNSGETFRVHKLRNKRRQPSWSRFSSKVRVTSKSYEIMLTNVETWPDNDDDDEYQRNGVV